MYSATLLQEKAPEQSAPAAGGGAPQNPLGSLWFIVAMIGIFYFLAIRPQQKRQKEHNKMIEALKIGSRVVTQGGILGTISKLEDKNITIEIARGTYVVFQRSAVTGLQSDSEKASDKKDEPQDKKAA